MSDEQVSEISLKEIDMDYLENVEENREAVEFRVRLSGVPTDVWRHEFEQSYLHMQHTLKPPVRLDGDLLHVIYLPRYVGELSGFFDFLARVIRVSNEEAHVTADLHTSNAQERQKAEFREALRSINLPGS